MLKSMINFLTFIEGFNIFAVKFFGFGVIPELAILRGWATIRPKRRFVPRDNSSQITKSDNSSQAAVRPILKRRQFVPFVKSDNSSQIV